MSSGTILLLVFLAGGTLLMLRMHRGGAHQGHGGGGCGGGGGGHSGHDHEQPSEEKQKQEAPVLGKPGPQHNEAARDGQDEPAGGRRRRGC